MEMLSRAYPTNHSLVRRSAALTVLGVVATFAAFTAAPLHAQENASIPAGHPLATLPAGHWYRVPNSELQQADPCPQIVCPPGNSGLSAIMGAWSGGTFDGLNDRLLIWGGGHGDYAGNEIYGFDIETMTWSIVAQPSSSFGGNINGFFNSDGKPRALHTGSYIEFVPTLNAFISFGAVAQYPNGNSRRDVYEYDFDTNEWDVDRIPVWPTGGGVSAMNAVFDVEENAVWLVTALNANNRLHRYDVATNSWTSHATYGLHRRYTMAAIDTDRRKIVAVGNSYFRAWDLNNPNADPIVPNASGPSVLVNEQAPGFQYDPTIRKFVGWYDGADVITLDPDTWQWERLPPAPGNSVVPTDARRNGTYGRFRYMPNWNAYVLVNDVDQSVYFYKLSDQDPIRSEPPEQLQ